MTARADQGPEREKIPRVLLRAMFALVVASSALVVYARLTDRPLIATPPESPVVAERMIFLDGDMAGAARVLDASGSVIADLAPEQGGFISGVYRVLLRERTKHRVALTGPVILRRAENGRVAVFDPSTGWSADLMGFGTDNARAFARLLD